MRRIAHFIVDYPKTTLAVWLLVLGIAAPFALRLGSVAQGGSEAIRGSESHAVMTTLNREFGRGAAHVTPVVVTSESLVSSDVRFSEAVTKLARDFAASPRVLRVLHPWNSGLPELLGRDGHSALLLIQPDATTLIAAENSTATLRAIVAQHALPAGWTAHVTGMSAMFYDLNRRSSSDLLRAEALGVPLTLIVLFIVFRTATAAALALAIAMCSVTLSSALLCLANPWLPASLLAQNVVTMIGLGAGTDYALFILSHYRDERARGASGSEAIVNAVGQAGPAVLVSGLAVAGGFAALFLVNVRFVHSLALGGIAVIAGALAATLTLLPALVRLCGDRVMPKSLSAARSVSRVGAWSRWAAAVMQRPRMWLTVALAIAAVCAWPAWRAQAWRIGARDLPLDEESRRGLELLKAHFEPGWMAPVAITLEAPAGHTLWEPSGQAAALQMAGDLRSHPLVAQVLGFPRVLETLGPSRETIPDAGTLPASVAEAARTAISADGRTGLVLGILREPPETNASVELIETLRSRARSEAEQNARGIVVKVGGGTAVLHDFDRAMFRSVRHVMVAVIVMTFGLLLLFFRSVAVPLKAIAANLLSVMAAYGFLVLLFQDGIGARLLGISPPGGLNSFVVLMLFTILFGLSMDYEIFLLSRIRDEFRATQDNTGSVAAGLSGTAGLITSAAAVMVCLFGSFGFFGLTASRQFGLGLAFAVAFDATVIRLLIVPAAMRLLGRWNWWAPGFAARSNIRLPDAQATEEPLTRADIRGSQAI
jgi:putative drug exporter of the RND superfamily